MSRRNRCSATLASSASVAVGENLAAQVAQHRPRIGNGRHVSRQPWIFRRPPDSAPRGSRRPLRAAASVPESASAPARRLRCAASAERRRDIGNRIEPQPNRRAARRGLRLARRAPDKRLLRPHPPARFRAPRDRNAAPAFPVPAWPSGLRTKRPSNWRSGSNSSRSALKFCKGSLNHGQRALGKTILRAGSVPPPNPRGSRRSQLRRRRPVGGTDSRSKRSDTRVCPSASGMIRSKISNIDSGSTSSPVSSRTSRRIPSSSFSPVSRMPPGMDQ